MPGASSNRSGVPARQAHARRPPAAALRARAHASRQQAPGSDHQGRKNSAVCSHLLNLVRIPPCRAKRARPPLRTATRLSAPRRGEGDACGVSPQPATGHQQHTNTHPRQNTCLHTEHASAHPSAHGTSVWTQHMCLHTEHLSTHGTSVRRQNACRHTAHSSARGMPVCTLHTEHLSAHSTGTCTWITCLHTAHASAQLQKPAVDHTPLHSSSVNKTSNTAE